MYRLVPIGGVLLALLSTACSRSPQYYLDIANKLAAQGHYADADLNYRKAIQKNSAFGEAYFQLGLINLKQGKVQPAYQALSTAAQLLPAREDVQSKFADLALTLYLADPRRPQAVYSRVTTIANQLIAKNARSFDGLRLKGHLAMADQNLSDAEAFYAQANAVKPMQPGVILAWTEALFQDKKPKEAEDLAFQLIRKEQHYGPIYEALFRYYRSAGRTGDAEKILQTKRANNPNDAASSLQLAAFYASASREAEMKSVLQQMIDNPKVFPQARLQVGDLYGQMQRWNDALQQYEAGAEALGGDKAKAEQRVVYLRKIADVWLAQGKGEQASKVVDEILKQEPGDAAASAVKASLLMSSRTPENVAKAVALLQPVLAKNPDNAVLHFTMGRILAAKGDLDGARGEFQQAIQKRPAFLEPRLVLAQLSQARGDYNSALRYSTEILSINPRLPAIKLLRAVSLMNTGKPDEGRAELAALEKDFPQNYEVQLQLAMLALRDKKYKEAEDRFRKLAQNAPQDGRSTTGLVNALAAENQMDKAVALLEEDLKKSPGNNQVRYLLASAEMQAGKYDLALNHYQQLFAIAPKSEQISLALGAAYRMKGDIPTALSYYQKAGALAPKDRVPLLMTGETLQAAGRIPEALATYRRLLQLNAEDAVANNAIAYLVAETGGNLDEALKLAQKALQLSPKQPNFSDTLGWIYFKRNLNDSAVQVFRVLTQEYPDNPLFHYHFGMVLLQKGDKETAKTELNNALSKKPSGEVRGNIESALAKAS
jgi:tetratricopeptide (TPR) repeat protein